MTKLFSLIYPSQMVTTTISSVINYDDLDISNFSEVNFDSVIEESKNNPLIQKWINLVENQNYSNLELDLNELKSLKISDNAKFYLSNKLKMKYQRKSINSIEEYLMSSKKNELWRWRKYTEATDKNTEKSSKNKVLKHEHKKWNKKCG